MSFQEDFDVVNAAMARDGKRLPWMFEVPVEKQEEYAQIIRDQAAELRGIDVSLAHKAAEVASILAHQRPVTQIREDVYAMPLADGTPAMATVLFVPREDGTISWTVSNVTQDTAEHGHITTYHGIIGVDGVAYASMQVDGTIPMMEAQG